MNETLENVHVPNKRKLPLYGPLEIEDQEKHLQEEAKRFLACYVSPFPYQLSVDNFQKLYQIGSGAFGVVLLVRYKLFGSYYAMKVLNKKSLVLRNQVKRALSEKYMLQSLNCPFTIYLLYFSQDNSNIYFILPFINGGELYTRLTQFAKFSENLTKFYASQVVLALEYLHRCGIIYRDLKPENILLDHLGYIKITDFGLAKLVHHRTYTFCGTPDYLAPEIVLNQGYGRGVDWWALGVLIYEMATGRPPFYAADDKGIFENIISANYVMKKDFTQDLKDLIAQFLERDITKRIGNLKSGVQEIKNHAWFKEINWLAVLRRSVVPPYVPADANHLNTTVFPELKDVGKFEIAEDDEFEDWFREF